MVKFESGMGEGDVGANGGSTGQGVTSPNGMRNRPYKTAVLPLDVTAK